MMIIDVLSYFDVETQQLIYRPLMSMLCWIPHADQEGKCGGGGCMEGSWNKGRDPSLEDCPVQGTKYYYKQVSMDVARMLAVPI